jgi:hypothetical protein
MGYHCCCNSSVSPASVEVPWLTLTVTLNPGLVFALPVTTASFLTASPAEEEPRHGRSVNVHSSIPEIRGFCSHSTTPGREWYVHCLLRGIGRTKSQPVGPVAGSAKRLRKLPSRVDAWNTPCLVCSQEPLLGHFVLSLLATRSVSRCISNFCQYCSGRHMSRHGLSGKTVVGWKSKRAEKQGTPMLEAACVWRI